MPTALHILLATLLLTNAHSAGVQPEPPPPAPTIQAAQFSTRAGTTSILLDSGIQVHIKSFPVGTHIAALVIGPELLESPDQLGLTRLVASSLDLSAAPGWSSKIWPEGIALQHSSYTPATPATLTPTLATLASILKSPRLDPARFAQAKSDLLTAAHATADGKASPSVQAIGAMVDPFNQAHAKRLTPELVQAITIEAAQAFADARFAQRAIDIALVTPANAADVITIVQSNFADLPARTRDRLDAARDLPRPPPTTQQTISSSPNDLSNIVLAFPAPPQSNLTQARLSFLASKLMQAELAAAIKEQGLKPRLLIGNAIPGRVLPNTGLCVATAVVNADAAQAEKLIAATRERLTRLVAQGPTQASFDRARQDLLDDITLRLESVDYWFTSLPVAWFLNVPIDELATAPDTLANLKPDDLHDHLRTWWQPDLLSTLTATPQQTAPN